ncbi:MAG: glycosyltransferase [Oligoflexia bacterium]|nr:glycosyltransferase [Oligoflexia bacterium]
MKILQYYPGIIPPRFYGGTERVVYSLSKALAEHGHEVTVAAHGKSSLKCARLADIQDPGLNIEKLAESHDIVHYHVTPPYIPVHPYLVTIHGNMQKDEGRLLNTVFLSRDHAARHGSRNYVYNGLDLTLYRETPGNKEYFTFLSKVSWGVKGARIAVNIAKKLKLKLVVAGGKIWWSRYRGIRSHGLVDDVSKADILSGSKALLFPLQWDEPFGLVAIESLASGTPVVTLDRGSMGEIVGASSFVDWNKKVGFVCKNIAEIEESIYRISEIDRNACSEYARKYFNHYRMANDYLALYTRIIKQGEM